MYHQGPSAHRDHPLAQEAPSAIASTDLGLFNPEIRSDIRRRLGCAHAEQIIANCELDQILRLLAARRAILKGHIRVA